MSGKRCRHKAAPLTREQRQFAAENHGIIMGFLGRHRLPMEDYYDIVAFGYLKAVRQYLAEPATRRYAFATVAWRRMGLDLISHFRRLKYKKRNTEVLSLHARVHHDGPALEDILPARNGQMERLEDRLLLHELAGHISPGQMELVHLRKNGYRIQEIADMKNISPRTVRNLLRGVRAALLGLGRD